MGSYSDFLFVQPSTIEGAARLLDFADSLTQYNRSEDPDVVALRAGVAAVGDDMRRVIGYVAESRR